MEQDVRWKQRFENFDRAFMLLREVHERGIDSLTQLEREGAIQRFEMAYELAWKTLRDYLAHIGIEVHPVAPREVIKAAFAARLLDDAQIWIDMMLERNRLAHNYDVDTFELALKAIDARYYGAFSRLHADLSAMAAEA